MQAQAMKAETRRANWLSGRFIKSAPMLTNASGAGFRIHEPLINIQQQQRICNPRETKYWLIIVVELLL
jgi:hypothetical protein